MARTIGNPLSWGVQRLGEAGSHLGTLGAEIGGNAEQEEMPVIRRIGLGDLGLALRRGLDDLGSFRSDVIFVAAFWPLIGLALVWVALDRSLIPLIFPLLAGFAILGPVAALGLYEMSRRREGGLPVSWADAAGFLRSPALGPVLVLAGWLLATFLAWMLVAERIYLVTLGPEPPASIAAFARATLTTEAGWWMIAMGMGAGFVFAAVTLAVSLVSFPLLLDRHVGLPVAVVTSVRLTLRNPLTVAAWGAVVAALLVLGTLPMLIGLILVLPLLGHATWHLYRRAVVPPARHGSGAGRPG